MNHASIKSLPWWRAALRAGVMALGWAAAWLASPVAHADLVWTPDGGWHVEGGVLEKYFGTPAEATSALDGMNKAKAAQEAGRYWGALTLYDKVIADYPSSIFAPEAYYQKGLIYILRHEYGDAYDSFSKIISTYPDYPGFNTVIRQQYQIARDLQDGKRPYIMWGYIPWLHDYDSAAKFYDGIAKSAPFSEFAPLALMNLSLVARNETDDPAMAIDALERLINDYPQSMLASNAYLDIAGLYSDLVIGPPYDQGSTREAIRYYKDYLYLYKTSPEAKQAEDDLNKMTDVYARSQSILGDFYYYYRNNSRAALIYYNQAITLAPSSAAAAAARDQIRKIQLHVLPPMTPYDFLFGRYKEPDVVALDEQGQIENLANQAFAAQTISDFVESPGDEAVETIGANGQANDYEGTPAPEEPGLAAPPEPAQPIPVKPLPGASSTPAQGPDRPLLR